MLLCESPMPNAQLCKCLCANAKCSIVQMLTSKMLNCASNAKRSIMPMLCSNAKCSIVQMLVCESPMPNAQLCKCLCANFQCQMLNCASNAKWPIVQMLVCESPMPNAQLCIHICQMANIVQCSCSVVRMPNAQLCKCLHAKCLIVHPIPNDRLCHCSAAPMPNGQLCKCLCANLQCQMLNCANAQLCKSSIVQNAHQNGTLPFAA